MGPTYDMRHQDHSGEAQEAHGVWMHAHRPVRTTQRLEYCLLRPDPVSFHQQNIKIKEQFGIGLKLEV